MEEELMKEQRLRAQKSEELYIEGTRLLREKNFDKAYEAFRESYRIYPRNFNACFKLFVGSIYNMDYDEAFKYFETLYLTNNSYYQNDNNFYLFLLSIITDIPDKYREHVKNLTLDEVKVNSHDARYQNSSVQNEIRLAAMKEKFDYAIYLLRANSKGNALAIQSLITKMLLRQASDAKKASRAALMELISGKKYKEIIDFLESKKSKRKLAVMDIYILDIVNQVVEILDTNKVPEQDFFETYSIKEAINAHNYDLALKLAKEHSAKYNISEQNDLLCALLNDVCELVKRVSSNDKEADIEEEPVKKEEEPALMDIIGYFIKNDLDNVFSSLTKYLKAINKEKYEFLIVSLTKISLIEKDSAFTKPLLTLIDISKDTYKLNIMDYIQQFYITLAQNKFEEAKIYLNIITRLKDLVGTNVLVDDLLQALKNAEGKQESRISVVELLPDPVPIKVEQEETVPTEMVEQSKPLQKRDSTIEFIEREHKLLVENQGIIILKPMNSERRKLIHNIVSQYPDMVSFSIGAEPNKQMVLRYRKASNEYIDIKKLVEDSKLYYRSGNYKKCIETNLQILQTNNPSAITYSRMGMSYLKLGNIEEAITYLTVATHISTVQGGKLDYSDLVVKLKYTVDSEDDKPYFKMNEDSFKNDLQENYGIKNLDEITAYIFENNLDVETACRELGVPSEQVNIIRLIFAKKYYSQGNYSMGDIFVRTVEKSKNKTPFTLRLLDEVRRNKKFYINRVVGSLTPLKLTLK